MKARMEKYDIDTNAKKRTARNENLYSEVGNMNIDYVDIDVDNAVELNPSTTGRTSREDFQKQRELNKILPNSQDKDNSETTYIEPKEDRVYDINEILSMARKDKLFEDSEKKRLINTEYNILTKLDVGKLENEEMKKEDLKSLIDDIYNKETPQKKQTSKKYSRSEEARLLNDLFDDTETQENVELQEELSKEILDKEEQVEEPAEQEEEIVATQIITKDEAMTDTTTMYDFEIDKKSKKKKEKNKNMLEGVDLKEAKRLNEELEEDFIEEKESKVLIVAIIIVVILILLTCGFFVYEYFFGLK